MSGEERNVPTDEAIAILLEAHRVFSRDAQQTTMEALQTFVAAYNTGQISMEAGAKEQIGRLTVAALRRWRNQAARAQPLTFAGEMKAPVPLADTVQACAREDDTPMARKAAARAVILETQRQWQIRTGRRGWGSFKPFEEAYNTAEVIVPAWVRAEYPALGPGLLGPWWKAFQAAGAEGLLPRYGNRKGRGLFETDTELREAALALRMEFPRESSAGILVRIKAAFPGRKLPSQRALQRFLAAFS